MSPRAARRRPATNRTRRLSKTQCAEIMAGHVLADCETHARALDLAQVTQVLARAESGEFGGWVARVARDANERTTLTAARHRLADTSPGARPPVHVHLSIPGMLANDAALAHLRTHLDATYWSFLADEVTAQVTAVIAPASAPEEPR